MINLRCAPPVFSHESQRILVYFHYAAVPPLILTILFVLISFCILLIAGWATWICQSVRPGTENNWIGKYLAVRYSEEFYARKVLRNFQLSQEHPANSWWIVSTFGCFLEAGSSFSFPVLCEEKGRWNSHQKMSKTVTSKSLRFW